MEKCWKLNNSYGYHCFLFCLIFFYFLDRKYVKKKFIKVNTRATVKELNDNKNIMSTFLGIAVLFWLNYISRLGHVRGGGRDGEVGSVWSTEEHERAPLLLISTSQQTKLCNIAKDCTVIHSHRGWTSAVSERVSFICVRNLTPFINFIKVNESYWTSWII